MAIQADVERSRHFAQPHLYVIDFSSSAIDQAARAHPYPHLIALRRRRLIRRLRQAGAVVCWAGGSAALAMVVLGGIAGLR
jgi:hypothetical protein